MPEFLWSRAESRGRQLALAPLLLAEGPYRLGAWLHRRFYRWRPQKRVRLPLQVVSVGNLTVGGSGKTPVVGWLAGELSARGRKVAILSRGVGGRRNREVNVVSDGERVLLSPADVGDEPVLLARCVPGVAVLAGRNRAALGYRAAALFGAEVALLDDGFQHHRLERDLELVCLDAESGLGNGHVLPRGPLRESPGALREADALLWTRAPEGFDPATAARRLPAAAAEHPQFIVRLLARRLRPLRGGPGREPDSLRGQEVGLFAAIARPERLRAALEEFGAVVKTVRPFPDHHPYTRADLAGLDPTLAWVTTAKDAVKIPASWVESLIVEVLEEEVRPGADGLGEWVVERLDRLHQREERK